MKNSLLVHGIIVCAWLGLQCAQAAPANQTGFRLVVEMQDGSKVIGRGADSAFLFSSELMGEIRLSPGKVRTIESQPGTNVVKLTTANGDTLSAQLTMKEILLEAAFGKVVLPVDLIRRVSVSAWKSPMKARAGLVAMWSGDGNAEDALGASDGRLVNRVSFVPGKVGQAFEFDGGVGSYVEVPHSADLNLTDQVTITFWAKRAGLGVHMIVEKGGDWTTGQNNFEVCLNDDYSAGAVFSFGFTGGWRGCSVIPDLEWHHYAVVARNGQQDVAFYLDGRPQTVTRQGFLGNSGGFGGGGPGGGITEGGMGDGVAGIRLMPSALPLHIGAQIDPKFAYFGKTLIDELAIYNRALTAAEIQAICVEENNDVLPPPPTPSRDSVTPTRPLMGGAR